MTDPVVKQAEAEAKSVAARVKAFLKSTVSLKGAALVLALVAADVAGHLHFPI